MASVTPDQFSEESMILQDIDDLIRRIKDGVAPATPDELHCLERYRLSLAGDGLET